MRADSFLISIVLGCLGSLLACQASELDLGAPRHGAAQRTRDGEWRHYLGDPGRSHYSPLRQIDRENVDRLEVAWTYDTGPLEGSLTQIQCNPIVVDGVLYGTTSRAHPFAIDAATGRELWKFDPVAAGSSAQGHNRGLVYWDGPEGGQIIAAAGQDLWALDATTGEPVSRFGDRGRVDLRDGLSHESGGGDVTSRTPGAIYQDLLIIGTKVGETEGAAPGDIRAYDLETGEIRWIFHTIPHAGEFGAETWPAGSSAEQGGANSWAGVTLDEERGIVFLPTGSATPDFWGGDRHGDNLFANSLLALDAATGERIWHFQIVHHDLWDRDLPAPPNLVRFERDGRMIDAVSQTTKAGLLFVFDRETGEPIFPIEERPVHASLLDGEWVSPTQPFPTAPPPFTRQGFDLSMIHRDRREGFLEEQTKRLEGMYMGENFVPPSLEGSTMFPSFDGGAEWGGAAWDESTGLLYVNANEVGGMLRLMERPKGVNPRGIYLEKCGLCHGADLKGTGTGPSIIDVGDRRTTVALLTVIALGGGRMPSFVDMPLPIIERLAAYIANPDDLDVALAELDARPGSDSKYVTAGYLYLRDENGVPINEPPFGTLTAIDLAKGELRWQIPLGEYPHLVEQGLVGTGTENYGGPVVTAGGLLFIAASVDEKLRAFDKLTGEELWQATLPAAGYATPATYSVDGRQFVVIAAGGGKLGTKSGSKYVAYALPD
ncbi:MAG: pyrrolo-quinoline quinone [Deltaproteobacteria bacterium]|nr:pyrrolo-quinoline quinone [Deltaproteobacteria bacterium]